MPSRKKSILHNPLSPEQQQQALQQVEPITQQPTATYGTVLFHIFSLVLLAHVP